MAGKETVRMTVTMSPELNKLLEDLADKAHGSKSDILRRAIALYDVAVKARDEKLRVGLFNDNKALEREIVGL